MSDGGEVLVDGRVEPTLPLEDVVIPLALLGCSSIDIFWYQHLSQDLSQVMLEVLRQIQTRSALILEKLSSPLGHQRYV